MRVRALYPLFSCRVAAGGVLVGTVAIAHAAGILRRKVRVRRPPGASGGAGERARRSTSGGPKETQ